MYDKYVEETPASPLMCVLEKNCTTFHHPNTSKVFVVVVATVFKCINFQFVILIRVISLIFDCAQ